MQEADVTASEDEFVTFEICNYSDAYLGIRYSESWNQKGWCDDVDWELLIITNYKNIIYNWWIFTIL